MVTIDDFGGPNFEDGPEELTPPATVIPFPNMRPNSTAAQIWDRERTLMNNRGETGYRFISPLDALDEMMRKRALPTMPWPEAWSEFRKRARLYVGECCGIVGPSGGGKTSFALQAGIAATGDGHPVLWAPLELDSTEINLRIVANRNGIHTAIVRDTWTRERIAHALTAITDLWRYVDRIPGSIEGQINAFRAAVRLAKRVYGVPPVLIIDYIGKMVSLERDTKQATRAAAEHIRALTSDEECYTLILAQPSRANDAVLTGRTELASATEAIGVASDSGEIEHACAVMVGLNVFKADDTPALDAHALVSKARGSGMEGRQGFRFSKPGGVWSELAYLPATPGDVAKEVKRAKKDKSRTEPATPERARADVNAQRSSEADTSRRRYVLDALTNAGPRGMSTTELRKVRGAGRAQKLAQTLQELERAREIERSGGRWRWIPR